MKKKDKIKTVLKIAVLLIAAALIAASLTRIAYITYKKVSIYDIKEINASFIVGKKIGLSADKDVLNFGMVPSGGSSTKEIVLFHEYKEPLKIKITYTGDIAEAVQQIEPFYLEPGAEKKVSITAYAGSETGRKYTGTVKVFYIKT